MRFPGIVNVSVEKREKSRKKEFSGFAPSAQCPEYFYRKVLRVRVLIR